ncbi:peptidoglycan-binding protein [Leptolyngbya sp. NK1-12]|uniref:Peptidoglycan-binding protein n=2 Tax=Leptolyngbya sp. NK1-12 TaxID=2547451 RepID=A0AA97AIH9_9CYAN|nr:peptidoglycan-binding protein [Leptolyngbya sp. NK1-12]
MKHMRLFSMQSTSTVSRSLAVLRSGSTGNDVRLLQQRLNIIRTIPGLTGLAALTVDGNFGPRTAAGVRRFQTLFNLTVDGIVGPQTWSVLFRESLPGAFSETANFRPFRVEFAPSATSGIVATSSVRGDFEVYVVNAKAGQIVRLNITSPEDNAVIDSIVTANNQEVIPGIDDILRFPLTGDHLIVVGKTRGNATYQLEILIR